jgi:hypothetical protein
MPRTLCDRLPIDMTDAKTVAEVAQKLQASIPAADIPAVREAMLRKRHIISDSYAELLGQPIPAEIWKDAGR